MNGLAGEHCTYCSPAARLTYIVNFLTVEAATENQSKAWRLLSQDEFCVSEPTSTDRLADETWITRGEKFKR